MLFSSLIFLFVFLPLVLLAYYSGPRKWQNATLLLFSLLFYAWGGVSYSIILLISILINFGFAKWISLTAHRRTPLVAGILFNVALLVTFKYLGFFIENINLVAAFWSAGDPWLNAPHLILPLGISFFTFQQMSMLIDLHRSPGKGKVGIVDTALYVSFFPQLIAGPIVRYHDIIDQIKIRTVSLDDFEVGIRRFISGLFKKIVFANTLAAVADEILATDVNSLSTGAAWLGITCYALQIYFDFSGYSEMAIGLGRMFGFHFLENFNLPYISKSIKEFWRRWHISLSSWFRDYVYIPLGGNKVGNGRTYFNLLIVFSLTGFWHGATWSFLFWGLFHGAFLIVERLGADKFLQRLPGPISWIYTMSIVLFGWVFFRIEQFDDAIRFAQLMCGLQGTVTHPGVLFLDAERVIILLFALAASLGVFQFTVKKSWNHPLFHQLGKVGLILMLIYSIILINSGSYNPFIYFRF